MYTQTYSDGFLLYSLMVLSGCSFATLLYLYSWCFPPNSLMNDVILLAHCNTFSNVVFL